MRNLLTSFRSRFFLINIFCLIMISLLAIHSAILFDSSIYFTFNYLGFFSILIALISIVMCSFSISQYAFNLNLSIFWLFNYIFFGLTPLILSIDPNPYYLFQISSENVKIKAIIITLMGISVSALTQILLTLKPKKPTESEYQVNYLKLFRNSKILFWVYACYVIPVSNFLGGFDYLFKRIRFQNFQNSNTLPTNSIAFALIYVIPVVNAITLYFIREQRNLKHLNYYLVCSTIWAILLSNPLGNARQTSLFLILPFVWLWSHKSLLVRHLSILVIPMFIIFWSGFIDRFTGNFRFQVSPPLSRNGDFDAFAQLSSGIRLASEGYFPLFHQLQGSLFFYIPRSLFPSKPLDTGIVVAQASSLKFQNLSAPWILELYVNGRYFAVAISAFLIVLLLFKLNSVTNKSAKSYVSGAILYGLLFIILRGSLLQATGVSLFSFAVMQLLFYKTRISDTNREFSGNT